MAIRKLIRESAFQLTRRDVASFLEDHESDILAIFHEEMQRLDAQIPEENLFIDIRMVPLGEAILKAALHAITRFLLDDVPAASEGKLQSPTEELSGPTGLTLKDTSL